MRLRRTMALAAIGLLNPVLAGLAMALLACAYLSVQYLLALGHTRFLWLLGVAALVAINSFTVNLRTSVAEQAKAALASGDDASKAA